MKIFFLLAVILFSLPGLSTAQTKKVDNEVLKERIARYKEDARGPYRDIRWFCKDGSTVAPQEKCPEPGGYQRARYKEEVIALGKSNHVFLGQILSTTDIPEFWDAKNYHSRLKQYQLEKYLRSVDDGWILRKGQFYRGAFQIEDEEAWGINFFRSILERDDALLSNYFLLRQAIKDIPHRGDDSKTLNVRAVSKTISETYPAFQDLRVKIHGQPAAGDIRLVKNFLEGHREKLSPKLLQQFEILLTDLEIVYQPVDLNSLKPLLKNLPKESVIAVSLADYIQDFSGQGEGQNLAMATAERLAEIRKEILNIKTKQGRLALLDISNTLEDIFFRQINQWEPISVKETAEKICYTGLAAMGTGFIEIWEWEELIGSLSDYQKSEMTLQELHAYLDRARSLIEWGTGMVRGVYKDVVNLYAPLEPQAYGFIDDRIRSSVLLTLGEVVGDLGDFIAEKSNLSNKVLDLTNQSTVRGLNPGFARGELVVVDGEGDMEVSNDKIYIFRSAPADLKPVAGIMTVNEGNMVSHVQLLARNLGIPNAVLSAENMSALKPYAGSIVFYAVSNRGTVIIKKATEMTAEENDLFTVRARSEDRIRVPVEKIELNQTSVLNLRAVDASSSGKVCGPKAANLGQLKSLFPDRVVEGLVIPFGIFRDHLNQEMNGQGVSFWNFLNNVFNQAEKMRATKTDAEVEEYTLSQLQLLRDAMKQMTLSKEFIGDLEQGFENILGKKLGSIPVFLRSDTNMEDLKDFTGAGLNLTLFNIVDRESVLSGIKDVWASPYTERSFKWRQRYLLNPENVFPSILIIPSVDVEYSGVVITKGIPTADPRDATIAFSRGAGGAVDGQAAESYLLSHQAKNLLLSPAREPAYRRLPASGGSRIEFATFEKPVLNAQNLFDLRQFIQEARTEMPAKMDIPGDTPLDIELGFLSNKIWLFQVRPFVENKNAINLSYLESISPAIDRTKLIVMSEKIK